MKLQTGQNKIQYLSPKLSWLRIWAKNVDAETLAPWLQLPVASDRQLKSLRTRPNSQPKFLSHIAKWCLGLSLIISKPSFCPSLWWLVNTPGSSTLVSFFPSEFKIKKFSVFPYLFIPEVRKSINRAGFDSGSFASISNCSPVVINYLPKNFLCS